MHGACSAYDRAAYKMRSGSADFNFPATDYSQDSFIKAWPAPHAACQP